MIDDFVKRLQGELDSRRLSYLDKLVACSRDDHDRMAGRLLELKDIGNLLNRAKRDFLAESDQEDAR